MVDVSSMGARLLIRWLPPPPLVPLLLVAPQLLQPGRMEGQAKHPTITNSPTNIEGTPTKIAGIPNVGSNNRRVRKVVDIAAGRGEHVICFG